MKALIALLLPLLVIVGIIALIAKLINKQVAKVLIGVFVFLLLVYGVILLLQPSSFIEYNTDFSNATNTHLQKYY